MAVPLLVLHPVLALLHGERADAVGERAGDGAAVLAEAEAGDDRDTDHGHGDGVGGADGGVAVRELRQERPEEQVHEVAEHTEHAGDGEDVELLVGGQRRDDVAAVGVVALPGGVGGTRGSTGEGDVRAEDRAEHDGVEEALGRRSALDGLGDEASHGGRDAGQVQEAGKDEGGLGADGRAERAAGEGDERPQQDVHV